MLSRSPQVQEKLLNFDIKVEELKQKKKAVLDAYGGKCVCCGEVDKEFLCLSNVFKPKQNELEISSEKLKDLLDIPELERYAQVLCFNCQKSLNLNGYCPHNKGILPPKTGEESFKPLDITILGKVERSWILWGSICLNKLIVYPLRKTEGDSVSVPFNWEWVLETEEKTSKIQGWLHTHPKMSAYPSSRDIDTMGAWVNCFGKPLLCMISGEDGLRSFIFYDDSGSFKETKLILSYDKYFIISWT